MTSKALKKEQKAVQAAPKAKASSKGGWIAGFQGNVQLPPNSKEQTAMWVPNDWKHKKVMAFSNFLKGETVSQILDSYACYMLYVIWCTIMVTPHWIELVRNMGYWTWNLAWFVRNVAAGEDEEDEEEAEEAKDKGVEEEEDKEAGKATDEEAEKEKDKGAEEEKDKEAGKATNEEAEKEKDKGAEEEKDKEAGKATNEEAEKEKDKGAEEEKDKEAGKATNEEAEKEKDKGAEEEKDKEAGKASNEEAEKEKDKGAEEEKDKEAGKATNDEAEKEKDKGAEEEKDKQTNEEKDKEAPKPSDEEAAKPGNWFPGTRFCCLEWSQLILSAVGPGPEAAKKPKKNSDHSDFPGEWAYNKYTVVVGRYMLISLLGFV